MTNENQSLHLADCPSLSEMQQDGYQILKVWPVTDSPMSSDPFGGSLDGPNREWQAAYLAAAIAFNQLPESERQADNDPGIVKR